MIVNIAAGHLESWIEDYGQFEPIRNTRFTFPKTEPERLVVLSGLDRSVDGLQLYCVRSRRSTLSSSVYNDIYVLARPDNTESHRRVQVDADTLITLEVPA